MAVAGQSFQYTKIQFLKNRTEALSVSERAIVFCSPETGPEYKIAETVMDSGKWCLRLFF